MSKFHINPTTGEPGLCKALVKCPFGDMETEHYSSKKSARIAYEALQESFPAKISYPSLNWASLTKDQRMTIHAGIMRSRYRSGTPERLYWDAVYHTTEAGQLWLKRKKKDSPYDYKILLPKIEEVAKDLPVAVEPTNPQVRLPSQFSSPEAIVEVEMPLGKGNSLDPWKEQLAYLSAVWISRLTPEEIDAASWMTSNGTTVMRQHLAGQEPEIWGYSRYSRKWLDATYHHFQSAMEKAPLVPEPVVIYRGTEAEHVTDQVVLPRSATLDRSTALGYGKGHFEGDSACWEVRTNRVGSVVCMSAWGATELEVFIPLGPHQTVESYRQTCLGKSPGGGKLEYSYEIEVARTECLQ